jgi:hypothetical protein
MAHLCLYKKKSALPIMVAYGAVARIKKFDLHFLHKVFKYYKVEILFS